MKIDAAIIQPLTLADKQPAFKEINNNNDTFGRFLNESLKELNKTQVNADQAIKQFLAGGGQDVHSVAIALGEAKLSMELAVQVRNKLLEAYQEMMRMQV